jgi:5-methylcytosine-specific restriction protein A
MARAARTCSSCPTIITTGSRCQQCTAKAERARGSAAQRGYTGTGHRQFRTAVLARDPICKRCNAAWATTADHYPVSRRDLVDAGEDPNDPRHGRGLCHHCHSIVTAEHQPGGWHATAT